jgi:hypothetical protein
MKMVVKSKHAMKICTCFWIAFLACLGCADAAQEKAVLEVVPSLAELGEGWTTNIVAYLLDPRSQPPEIDFKSEPAKSLRLTEQREAMKTNKRTGCGLILYGRGDLVMNRGLYRVYIQRWADSRSLHNSWVDFKMNPARVVRNHPAVGEDFYWTNDWWRETCVGQNLVFRRGLFHVVVEAGPESDDAQMVQLAQAIDAKITGRVKPAEPRPGPERSGLENRH